MSRFTHKRSLKRHEEIHHPDTMVQSQNCAVETVVFPHYLNTQVAPDHSFGAEAFSFSHCGPDAVFKEGFTDASSCDALPWSDSLLAGGNIAQLHCPSRLTSFLASYGSKQQYGIFAPKLPRQGCTTEKPTDGTTGGTTGDKPSSCSKQGTQSEGQQRFTVDNSDVFV